MSTCCTVTNEQASIVTARVTSGVQNGQDITYGLRAGIVAMPSLELVDSSVFVFAIR